jgi:hypothetical protein
VVDKRTRLPKPKAKRKPLPDLLSVRECSLLLLNCLPPRGERGMSQDDIEHLHAWANQARMANEMLTMALRGELILDVVMVDGKRDVTFRKPTDADKERFREGLKRVPYEIDAPRGKNGRAGRTFAAPCGRCQPASLG